jgi:hypothetical protein
MLFNIMIAQHVELKHFSEIRQADLTHQASPVDLDGLEGHKELQQESNAWCDKGDYRIGYFSAATTTRNPAQFPVSISRDAGKVKRTYGTDL